MWEEFKKFAMKGNVLDLAIGVVIGGAFGKIVTSLVDDIIMPIVGSLVGRVDFSNLYINLSGENFNSINCKIYFAVFSHPRTLLSIII